MLLCSLCWGEKHEVVGRLEGKGKEGRKEGRVVRGTKMMKTDDCVEVRESVMSIIKLGLLGLVLFVISDYVLNEGYFVIPAIMVSVCLTVFVLRAWEYGEFKSFLLGFAKTVFFLIGLFKILLAFAVCCIVLALILGWSLST